tara:strand:+ start:2122 stop:2355 length:234 start_codon:yes stop_codon:yes gene_type:complete
MDISYNEIKIKLNKIKSKYPRLTELWLCYLQKHTLLYKNVLKETNHFIETVDDILLEDMNKNNILFLYLILNNDINI